MTYAKVINGEIVENNRTLPFSTSETSFGINTSIETMKEFGYLPIVGTEPTLTVNQRVNGVSYIVGADEVTKVYNIVIVTDEELFKATVPQSITALQGLLAIDAAGMSSVYEAWANDAARTFTQKAFINRAQIWNREDATLLSAASIFGLTKRQIDDLFILGATL